jgi:uncharacterized protein (TIGR03437 family)
MRGLWVLLALSSLGLAQPYINYRGVVNVASYMAPGLPSGSLPRGGMVAIFGRNLGPAAGAQAQSFPLQTTLSNVSVTITQKTTTVNALPVYVGPGQINAIVPSNAPLGRGTMQVTVNGVVSNPSPVNVVTSSFGIIAVNGGGFGPGIIQNFTGAPVDPVNSSQASAKPGQLETLWGTGLGPVAQDNVAPTAGNLPVPVEVFVGGQSATVVYSGRSGCCSGIDEIFFNVPANAPTGCYVPVVVRLNGTLASNTVTMAIDTNGAPCTDPANSLGAILRSGGRLGGALLTHEDDNIASPDGTVQPVSTDLATVALRQEAGGVWAFNPYISYPPVGTCTSYTMAGQFPALNDLPGIAATVKDLNGGPSLSVTGPSQTATLPQVGSAPSVYTALLGTSANITGVPLSFFVTGSASQVAGTGGADVGAFQASVTAAAGPTWSNASSTTTVNRSAGFTVNWTNVPAGANVVSIVGFNVDQPNNVTAGFQCMANPAAGTFTVPAVAMANMPATSPALPATLGWLAIGAAQLASPGTFTATGLDHAIAIFGASKQQSVVFQ